MRFPTRTYDICAELRDDLHKSVDALTAFDTMLAAVLAQSDLKARASGIHVLLRQQIEALAEIETVAEALAARALEAAEPN